MSAMGLTPRQHECLLFINEFSQKHGFSPSFDEIREALGLASKSGVHRLVHGLKQRGFIGMFNGQSRSVVIRAEPPQAQTTLLRAWKSASLNERTDFLFLIGARLECEAA